LQPFALLKRKSGKWNFLVLFATVCPAEKKKWQMEFLSTICFSIFNCPPVMCIYPPDEKVRDNPDSLNIIKLNSSQQRTGDFPDL
jgi:hypothetical protein